MRDLIEQLPFPWTLIAFAAVGGALCATAGCLTAYAARRRRGTL